MKPLTDHDQRSRLPLVLWLGTAIFIVYGTTIPFRFVSDPQSFAQHVAYLRNSFWATFAPGHHVSGPDFVSNVWLFTPFGCFGMWALRRPRSRIVRALLLTVLSCALSASVEALQLFTLDRVSTASDILGNTAGGAIGAVAGIMLRTTASGLLNAGTARGIIQNAAFYPFLAALILVCAGAWEPFDVTIDVGSVVPKVRSFLHDPIQHSAISDEGVSFTQHLLFTAALYVWLMALKDRDAARRAAIVGVAAAFALEGSQIIIGSRMPGLWDAGVAAAGALAGIPIGVIYLRRRFSPIWPLVLIGATLAAAAIQQLSPFVPVAGDPRRFEWMPFLNYYQFTTSQTVSHCAELLLTYMPLGFGLALAAWAPRARWLFPLCAALAIAAPLEYLQRFVGGRYPDVTDIAMSLAGAWIGAWTATRGWQLFAADMKVISSHPAAAAPRSQPSPAAPVR